jgi:hypothetical protein
LVVLFCIRCSMLNYSFNLAHTLQKTAYQNFKTFVRCHCVPHTQHILSPYSNQGNTNTATL